MILVFVGAGGSAAVDPKQYPTTVGFFESLPSETTDNPLFGEVHKFLKSKKKGETIDIEDVLGALDELQKTFKKINDSTNIVGRTMSGHLVPIKGISDFGAFQESIASWERDTITPLNNRIKGQVYNFYAAIPEIEKLSDWALLLKGLEKIDPALEIFTTNYDLVLETVIKETGINVETGRVSDNIRTRLDTTFWKARREGKRGLFTKLHGSVDWQLNNEEIIMSPVFTGDHQKHCILYPGYKGEPTEEPFSMFHEYLQKIVEDGELSAAIFIGFAFRDAAINRILSRLSLKTLTFFITKPDITPLPPEKRPPRAPLTEHFRHLCGGLTAETVEICLGEVAASMRRSY